VSTPDRVEYWAALDPDAVIAMSAGDTGPTAPVFRYEAALRLAELERRAADLSGFDVLAAVRICAARGLVLPDWLARAFTRRYDAVLNVRALSWDDPQAFGRPYRKGTNQAALRKRRMLRWSVRNEVERIIAAEPATPIDEALFERAGAPYHLGRSLAADLYYETIRQLPRSSQTSRKYKPRR
jgi:hypothetical protein